MAPRHLLALAVALACGPALAATAGAPDLATDKHPHPENRDLVHRRAPVPCDEARATVDLVAGMAWSFADTTAGEGAVASYACRSWDESGPEHVYLLEVAEELVVDIWLAGNEPVDHDLVLLSACDSDSCLVQANTEISARLPAGSYVLVVDGYQGAAGAYDLSLEARTVGIPAEICEGGAAEDLGTIAGGDVVDPIADTLFGQPNRVSVYDCSPVAVRGGERWYAITLAAADTTYEDDTDIGSVRVEITATPGAGALALDLACWLFDGCGPDAACLAFADAGASGAAEQLAVVNHETAPITYYLAIDSIQAAPNEGGGAFELTTGVSVGAEVRSLGGVKALFR